MEKSEQSSIKENKSETNVKKEEVVPAAQPVKEVKEEKPPAQEPKKSEQKPVKYTEKKFAEKKEEPVKKE